MKKLLLLLLLLPYLAIAQSADATPIENILLTNAAEKLAATRVTVQDASTKELGFILKSTLNTNISIGNKNANTFQLLSSTGSGPVVPAVTTTEAGLSTASDKVLINTIAHTGATGLNQGGLLTINTDVAKFDLSAGFGYVVNGHSDPNNTTYTKVTWTDKIANTIPNIATQKQTYVAVDINGDLFLTNVPLTATERRNYIRIGVLIHLNNSAVTYIDNQPTVNIEIGGQVQDILEAIGFRSLSGNRVFPVSNNLKIKKELGQVFKSGANFDNLTTQPHSFTLAAQEPITFRYRTQTGEEGSDITDITPAIYDLNGTITPVAATATLATIQRVYIFQDGVVRIQPGQRVFTTLNAAITALNSDIFITDLDISENGLYLGAIVLTRNTVDLSNISQAIFAPSIGTTANGSVASPALGYTAEDVANKQNSLVVDGTGAKYPTVDAVNSGLDLKADDANVVHKDGNETISGIKNFTSLLKTTSINPLLELVSTTFGQGFIQNGVNKAATYDGVNNYMFISPSAGLVANGIFLNSNNILANDNIMWHAGNFTPANKLNTGGQLTTGDYQFDKLTTVNGSVFQGISIGKGLGNITTNLAVGFQPLVKNTIGNYNSAFGHYALNANTTGSLNTAIGVQALFKNTTGGYNLAVGVEALNNNTTGVNNTAIGGYDTLLNNTTGSSNVAVGYATMYTNSIGDDNTAIGGDALYLNTTGSLNTAVGRMAGDQNTTGSYNTFIGFQAGRGLTTGSSNTIIGSRIGGLSPTLTNNIILANGTGEIKAQNDGTNWSLKGDINTDSNVLLNSTTGNKKVSFNSNGINKGLLGLDPSVGGGSENNLSLYSRSGDLLFWANGVVKSKISSTGLQVTGNGNFSGTVTASPATVSTELATLGQVNAASSRPYKVYTALLTQSGTNAPTATVLENTLGGTIVWSRTSTGVYLGTLSGAFLLNKVTVFNTNGTFQQSFQGGRSSDNAVGVNTTTFSGALTDGLLNGNSIEIRVYN
jgi:hypothetical protein